MIGGTRVNFWENTLIERAFIGAGGADAVADQYAGVQLWNPANSEILIICRRISVWNPTGRNVNLYYDTNALTDAGVESNKRVGAGMTANVAQILTQEKANLVNYGTAMTNSLKADCVNELLLYEPIIIDAGYGVICVNNTINETFKVQFEWLETAGVPAA